MVRKGQRQVLPLWCRHQWVAPSARLHQGQNILTSFLEKKVEIFRYVTTRWRQGSKNPDGGRLTENRAWRWNESVEFLGPSLSIWIELNKLKLQLCAWLEPINLFLLMVFLFLFFPTSHLFLCFASLKVLLGFSIIPLFCYFLLEQVALWLRNPLQSEK